MAVLIENVGGLSRDVHSKYFEYVRMQLEFPSLAPSTDEEWTSHFNRLVSHRNSRSYLPEYQVNWKVINAADFGIPQRRRRTFVVAIQPEFRSYDFPVETHSRVALLYSQATGEYWSRHGIRPRIFPRALGAKPHGDELKPWVTVRDALVGVGTPADRQDTAVSNHWTIPGAREYSGHSGSDLDWPSKVIKAGTHGVAGGENTVRTDQGAVRYYTLREMARIQGFSDEHLFLGSRSSVIRQIGNAVPPNLATAIAGPLKPLLGGT